jgi:hypothetical protein
MKHFMNHFKKVILASLAIAFMGSAPAFAWHTPVNIEFYAYTTNKIELLNMYTSLDGKSWGPAIPVDLLGYPPGGSPNSKVIQVPHEPTAPCKLFVKFNFTNHPDLIWPNKAGQPVFNICTEHTIEVEFPGDVGGPTIPFVLYFE